MTIATGRGWYGEAFGAIVESESSELVALERHEPLPQFLERARFDDSDSIARQPEHVPDLVQRAATAPPA
jgi:hypothetical protein